MVYDGLWWFNDGFMMVYDGKIMIEFTSKFILEVSENGGTPQQLDGL